MKVTFPMFPDAVFGLFFILFLIAFVISIILTVVRAIRSSQSGMWPTTPQNQPTIKEREIIREIIKIRCPYCGNLYDETADKCPNCGAGKT